MTGMSFTVNGYEETGGYTIRCHVYNKTGKHGDITLEQALMQSCNPARWILPHALAV